MLRPDQKIIAELIEAESKVIDIGCGDGELLSYLEDTKNISAHGLEIEPDRVSNAVSNGLSVIQGDGDNDLQYYQDNSFNYAILGQTLQVMHHPKDVLEETLRIARKVIVVIPNFGHIRNRIFLTRRGRMPVTKSLSYQWYDTPNIHFCTIKDFIILAKELDCKIETQLYMKKDGTSKSFIGKGTCGANLYGEYGVFILSK